VPITKHVLLYDYYLLNIVIRHNIAMLSVNGKCIAITRKPINVNKYLLTKILNMPQTDKV